jgi:hypothetical protein
MAISILCLAGSALSVNWDALQAVSYAESPAVILDSREERILDSPRVAYNSRNDLFLAVYVYRYAKGDWDINGRVLNEAGQPTGQPFGIAYIGSIEQSHPDVAYQIMVSRAESSGIPYPSSPEPLSGPDMDRPVVYGRPSPAIAAGTHGRSVVVWADEELTVTAGGVPASLYSIVAATGAWGALRGDLDHDRDVDFIDLAIFAERWAEHIE